MAGDVKPIPDGYGTVTPSLTVRGCANAIDFYKNAFGAEERSRADGPGGTVMHAELQIGDSIVMMNDEFPDMGARGPESIGGSPVSLWLYVEDVDSAFQRAIDAGAKSTMDPDDMFWGDRMAAVTDPYGHKWSMATHVEDVPPDEMQKRQQQAQKEWES